MEHPFVPFGSIQTSLSFHCMEKICLDIQKKLFLLLFLWRKKTIQWV